MKGSVTSPPVVPKTSAKADEKPEVTLTWLRKLQHEKSAWLDQVPLE